MICGCSYCSRQRLNNNKYVPCCLPFRHNYFLRRIGRRWVLLCVNTWRLFWRYSGCRQTLWWVEMRYQLGITCTGTHIEIDRYQYSLINLCKQSTFKLHTVPYHESESYHHQCLKESPYLKTFSGSLSVSVPISLLRMYLCIQMSVNAKSAPPWPITRKLAKSLSPSVKTPPCIENFKKRISRFFILFYFTAHFILLTAYSISTKL